MAPRTDPATHHRPPSRHYCTSLHTRALTGPALLTVGVADASAEVVRQVGAIWARARNRRAGTAPPSATDCEDAASRVRRRLALEGATVLLARWDDDVVGFALFAPDARAIEVFHLAVDPDVWGTGVAHALLREIDDTVRARDRTCW